MCPRIPRSAAAKQQPASAATNAAPPQKPRPLQKWLLAAAVAGLSGWLAFLASLAVGAWTSR
jgi:hypothetical protein